MAVSPKKKRKLHTVDLAFLYGFAVLFDALGILPVLGTCYILFVRLIFWIKGLNTSVINGLTAGGSLVEVIPAISLLPACTLYIFVAHMLDKAQSGDLGEMTKEGVDATSQIGSVSKKIP